MPELIYSIEERKHWSKPFKVKLPYGNEVLIQLTGRERGLNSTKRLILKAVRDVGKFVRNAPIHSWYGYPTIYLTVQHFKDKKDIETLINDKVWWHALQDICRHNMCHPAIEDKGVSGRLQLLLVANFYDINPVPSNQTYQYFSSALGERVKVN